MYVGGAKKGEGAGKGKKGWDDKLRRRGKGEKNGQETKKRSLEGEMKGRGIAVDSNGKKCR